MNRLQLAVECHLAIFSLICTVQNTSSEMSVCPFGFFITCVFLWGFFLFFLETCQQPKTHENRSALAECSELLYRLNAPGLQITMSYEGQNLSAETIVKYFLAPKQSPSPSPSASRYSAPNHERANASAPPGGAAGRARLHRGDAHPERLGYCRLL